jgi:prophage antirepressor-like protein
MEQPTAIPTTITFQNHTIRIVHKRNGSVWFVNADICQALGIADSRKALDVLTPYEMNVIDGSELNDHSELLLSIISESALNKLVHQVSNPKAKEFSEWVKTKVFPQFRLSDIDSVNHLMTEDILSKVQSLHLKALGTSNLQAILDTMQELMSHPKEYAEAMQYIDRTHDFLFDYPAKTSPEIYENLKGL